MKKSIVYFIIVLTSFAYANIGASNEDSMHTFEALINEGDASISESLDGKYYVNPSRIVVSYEGMFLQSDLGQLYPIDRLGYDLSGYYLQEPWLVIKKFPCVKCMLSLNEGDAFCRRCGFPTGRPFKD